MRDGRRSMRRQVVYTEMDILSIPYPYPIYLSADTTRDNLYGKHRIDEASFCLNKFVNICVCAAIY